jgi:formyltetrahydrofolate hydrolase
MEHRSIHPRRVDHTGMSGAPYLGRTLEDALNRADQDEIELRQVAQVNPADYDRIILAQYIRILEAVCAPYLKLGNAGYPIGNTDD